MGVRIEKISMELKVQKTLRFQNLLGETSWYCRGWGPGRPPYFPRGGGHPRPVRDRLPFSQPFLPRCRFFWQPNSASIFDMTISNIFTIPDRFWHQIWCHFDVLFVIFYTSFSDSDFGSIPRWFFMHFWLPRSTFYIVKQIVFSVFAFSSTRWKINDFAIHFVTILVTFGHPFSIFFPQFCRFFRSWL